MSNLLVIRSGEGVLGDGVRYTCHVSCILPKHLSVVACGEYGVSWADLVQQEFALRVHHWENHVAPPRQDLSLAEGVPYAFMICIGG